VGNFYGMVRGDWHRTILKQTEIKKPPKGGTLMCLLFSLPEGLAEQGLRPQAPLQGSTDP
jgi:hypothetical protein